MKYLIISAFAAVGILAATTLLRSHSPSTDRPVGIAGKFSPQELHSGSGANRLPIEEFEDLSLVFPARTKH